ncbi:hypothetical protein F5Y09DRAFT_307452 [Xylaria sp. FL1042]|nr:hypothetical protein F5Y09DRAFT_307452 [Xylaria sp. FL1042]
MAEAFGIGAGVVGVISLTIQVAQVAVQFGLDWKKAPDNIKRFRTGLLNLNAVLSQINSSILVNPEYAAAFEGRSSLLLSRLDTPPSESGSKSLLRTCEDALKALLDKLERKDKTKKWDWERLKDAFLAKDTREAVEDLHRECQILHEMIMLDVAVLGAGTNIEVKKALEKQYKWHQEDAETISAILGGVDQLLDYRQELYDAGERLSSEIKASIADLFKTDLHSISERVNAMHSLILDNHVDKKREKILNWITSSSYADQQNYYFRQRQAGTGQWFLDSPEFKTWVETRMRTLFCPGIPGAGKTILTSVVINELTTRFRNDESCGIAYVYCDLRQKDGQEPNWPLSSLLKQLAQRQRSLPNSVKSLYDKHEEPQTRPSIDEISETLQSVTAMYSKVFIIIDALDEYQRSRPDCAQSLSEFLSELFRLQTKCGSNIFATSRSDSEIDKFSGSISLEIQAHKDDVKRYLEGRMGKLPSFVQEDQQLQEEIKTGISEAVDGVFLLAQFYLRSLYDKLTPNTIRGALESLQKRGQVSDGDKVQVLTDTYNQTMERINGQAEGFRELARKVLLWVTYAKRPLTTFELLDALTVQVSKSKLDPGDCPRIEDIVSVCAGLVRVDKDSKIIRLVHSTVQDYFNTRQHDLVSNLETEITTICVRYLSFDVFRSGFCLTNDDFENRLASNSLYDYAAHNWGYHARNASSLPQEVIEFLKHEENAEASSQALMAVKRDPWLSEYSQKVPRQVTGLHLAAYFGINEAAHTLLNQGQSPDLRDSYGRTPLSYAAENGHEKVVNLLLENGADFESKDEHAQTSLLRAAWNGHETVVKLLLDHGANVESRDKYNRTPLSYAEENGHEAILELLQSYHSQNS